MQINLTEYQTLRDIALNPNQLACLQKMQLQLKLQITPSSRYPGTYDLTPESIIGVVQWPEKMDLRLSIAPKLPLRSLFFLLAYSMSPRFYDQFLTGYQEETELHEMLARCYVVQLEKLLRRGLLQGYRTEEDALQVVRGRIDFSTQLRQDYGRLPPVHCIFQEFSEDTPENQLLLAALTALQRLRYRDQRLRLALNQLSHRFGGVSHIHNWRQVWAAYTPTRLNTHYHSALALGRQILLGTGLSQDLGDLEGVSFQIDMNKAFEDFVVIALREALQLDERQFPQNASGKTLHLDTDRRIRLEPDLSWWEGSHCVFIGDVKYKRTSQGKATNPDIYQLLAYCEATGLETGLLIYADSQRTPLLYQLSGSSRQIQVQALQLNVPEEALLEQIQVLAKGITQTAHEVRQTRLTPV